MSFTGPGSPYDFILQDTAENPSLELGLTLAYDDETGLKRWREGRTPPLPPRRSQGPLNWTHKDPLSDYVFSQNDWSRGAFRPYADHGTTGQYAKSNGVDLRWEGVAALGPRRGPIRTGGTIKSRIQSNVFMANGDWEEGQVVGWSAGTGTTLTVETTTVRTGNYSGKAVVAQGTAAGVIFSQAVPNPTVYRSREVTVIAYLRRSAGSDAGVLLRVKDSAGQTDSSAVSTDAWTYVSATRTIDSGATSLTIELVTDANLSTDAHTFYQDDCYIVPTGGVECTGGAIRASTDPDEAYVALGRCVLYWSESDFAWIAGYIDASAAVTDIIEFNNTIYVAFGEANGATPHQYVYGSTTSWTTAALNATTTHQDNHARYWVKARNGFGEWALWKAGPSTNQGTERNKIYWATDPATAWTPSSPFTVGSDSREITRLHPFRDTFVVTKVDGIWVWDGTINDFVVLTQEWEHSADAANGAVGQLWHHDLYLGAIRQGFFRFAGNELEDLSPLLMAPRLTDFGGRVTAMTACARELILGLDQPTADTTTDKTSRLARMRLSPQGEWQLHTTQEPTIGLIDELFLHRDTRLWVFGRTYDSNLSNYVPGCNVFIEPDKVAAPFADATPSIEWTGWFETSIWHGGTPETDKAFIALTIWCEDLDSSHTIRADFGRDGRAANNTILGTFNGTERVQTIFFKNIANPLVEAQGRFVQLRFTFTTNDTTSPKMYAFALHTQLVPPPIRQLTIDAYVGGQTPLNTGVPHELSKSEIEDAFKQLEAQVFPPVLLEDFGQTHGGEEEGGGTLRFVRLVDYARWPEGDLNQDQERWRLVFEEVSLS